MNESTDIVIRAAGIIIRDTNDGAEILVIQEPSGLYNIPGGGQDEEDEGDIITTLHRELKEEVGLEPDMYSVEDTKVVNRFDFKHNSGRFGSKGESYAFLVRLNETANPKVTKDIMSFKWCKLEKALECIIHDDVRLMLSQVADKYKIF
jgi:8-oxo-dGTP pyrophosphatase MutT (NUDIX family)